MRLGGLHQLLQIELWRAFGQCLDLRRIAQQVIDFMAENQRQTGERQHQQKGGADQAGPGVDKGPAANGFAFHEGPKCKNTLVPVGASLAIF